MIPIIKWEFKQRKTSLLWWSFAFVITIVILMAVYPSIHDQAQALNKVLNTLPSSIKTLKTGGSNVDITTPIGWLNSQVFFVTLPLLLSIFSITAGKSLIGNDEKSHTMELLLARPISRTRLLFAKGMSGLAMVFALGFVCGASTVLMALITKMDISLINIWMTSLWMTLMVAAFGAIAFALSAAGPFTRKISMPVALILSFGGYIISSLGGLTHWLKTPAKLLPYHYFDPVALLKGNDSKGLSLYLLGILLVSIVVSWQGFRARDLD